MADKQKGAEQAEDAGDAVGTGVGQATEAVEKLRSVVDQASRSVRELTQASEHWAKQAQARASEAASQLREQGNRAVGTVSETVEHNPLTSVAVAFAVGFLLASLVKR